MRGRREALGSPGPPAGPRSRGFFRAMPPLWALLALGGLRLGVGKRGRDSGSCPGRAGSRPTVLSAGMERSPGNSLYAKPWAGPGHRILIIKTALFNELPWVGDSRAHGSDSWDGPCDTHKGLPGSREGAGLDPGGARTFQGKRQLGKFKSEAVWSILGTSPPGSISLAGAWDGVGCALG